MFMIDDYRYKIAIKKENGIYLLWACSGSGKTRLSQLLREYSTYGERVQSYTYSDLKAGLPIETVLDPSKYDAILLDRYDMYYGTGVERIKEIAEQCIILIDCKRDFEFCNVGHAAPYMTVDGVEVH